MNQIYEAIAKLLAEKGHAVLVTVVERKGHGPAAPGAKMLVFSDGRTVGTVGGGALEKAAQKRAGQLIHDGGTLLVDYDLDDDNALLDATGTGMICGGTTSLFYETIGDAIHLVLFGAGHVGRAILSHARLLGFRVTLADSRQPLLEGLEGAEALHLPDYRQNFEDLQITEKSYVVVATHSHSRDADVMHQLYGMPVRPLYIGIVASSKKAEEMVAHMRETNPSADLSNLHMPVGLNIGGPSPQEIAISVLAEIQAVRYHRTGQKHMGKQWST